MNLNPLSFLGDAAGTIFGKVADKISPDKGKIVDGQNRQGMIPCTPLAASIVPCIKLPARYVQ